MSSYPKFLEGLRGASALYVVGHHVAVNVGWVGPSPLAQFVAKLFHYGNYAVPVFIVLSGYSLMLPVTRTEDGKLPGGFGKYLYRRARRILPPYYACLAILLLVIWIMPPIPIESYRDIDETRYKALAPPDRDVVLSHVLLIHNLSADWIYKIDGPMWSVATEWQIYFLFPAFLFMRRRLGMTFTIVTAFVFGYGLFVIGHALDYKPAEQACPWYAGLFTLGMAGAARSSRQRDEAAQVREHRMWGLLALVFVLAALAFSLIENKLRFMADLGIPQRVAIDSIIGFTTVCLILHCHLTPAMDKWRLGNLARRALESAPAMRIGLFSYSLYLIHDPVLAWMNLGLLFADVPPSSRFAIMFVAGIPLVLLAAYGLYRLAERPFLHRRY